MAKPDHYPDDVKLTGWAIENAAVAEDPLSRLFALDCV